MEGFKTNPKMQCFKEGGQVKYETRKEHKEEIAADINQDKKIVKKAFKMHDTQSHEGEKTNLSKLKKGGRAKKETGTVKKYDKASGQYGAKKTAADNKNIQQAKQFKVKKMADGGLANQGAAINREREIAQALMDKENQRKIDRLARAQKYLNESQQGEFARGEMPPVAPMPNAGPKGRTVPMPNAGPKGRTVPMPDISEGALSGLTPMKRGGKACK
jgi:hypothetical protein